MNLPNWLKSAKAFTMATGGPTREDTYSVHVRVDTVGSGALEDFGIWDKMTGGDVDSNTSSYRPGAMGPPVSLGGQKTVSDITVSRLYRLERDHLKAKQLQQAVGNAKMMVSKQPLDIEGNAFGKPVVYNGRLKTVRLPPVDSESGNAGIIALDMSVDGYPA